MSKPVQISTGNEISESECTFSVGSMRSGSVAGSLAPAGGGAGAGFAPGVGALGGAELAGAGVDLAGGSAAASGPPEHSHSRTTVTLATLMMELLRVAGDAKAQIVARRGA